MLLWTLIAKRIKAWNAYRSTYKALAELDVRARADIGVTWLEIDSVARRAALRALGA